MTTVSILLLPNGEIGDNNLLLHVARGVRHGGNLVQSKMKSGAKSESV